MPTYQCIYLSCFDGAWVSHGHNAIKHVHKSKALQTFFWGSVCVLVYLSNASPRLPVLNSCSDYCKMMVSLIRFKQQVDAFIMYGHEYMGVLVAEKPTFTYIYFILHQITRSGQVGLRCLVAAGHHTIDRSMLDDHYWSPWLRDAEVKLEPNELNSITTRLQVFRQETWDSYDKHYYYLYTSP